MSKSKDSLEMTKCGHPTRRVLVNKRMVLPDLCRDCTRQYTSEFFPKAQKSKCGHYSEIIVVNGKEYAPDLCDQCDKSKRIPDPIFTDCGHFTETVLINGVFRPPRFCTECREKRINKGARLGVSAVSYTHLTLPTICSV